MNVAICGLIRVSPETPPTVLTAGVHFADGSVPCRKSCDSLYRALRSRRVSRLGHSAKRTAMNRLSRRRAALLSPLKRFARCSPIPCRQGGRGFTGDFTRS
jgi:hypothetical protein